MANIELLGNTYNDVPAVELPKSGGGTAIFYENPGSKISLLWSNSNILTSFGSQTIPFSGSYDAYIITFTANKDFNIGCSMMIPINNTGINLGMINNDNHFVYRPVTASSNSVYFNHGHVWGNSGNSDSSVIPAYIFGVVF